MISIGEDGALSELGPLLAVVVPDTVRTDMLLVGELDVATEPVVATLIEQQLATGHREVRIDLSELVFCDVRGMRALLQASRRLTAAGGQLVLVRPRPLFRRIVVLCGLSDDLGLLDSPPTDRAASSGQTG